MTTTIHHRTRVGIDGTITVSVGPADAGLEVDVTVAPAADCRTSRDRADWLRFIDETAGKWEGDFERPEPLPLEERPDLE
jgi:hypothetical protein